MTGPAGQAAVDTIAAIAIALGAAGILGLVLEFTGQADRLFRAIRDRLSRATHDRAVDLGDVADPADAKILNAPDLSPKTKARIIRFKRENEALLRRILDAVRDGDRTDFDRHADEAMDMVADKVDRFCCGDFPECEHDKRARAELGDPDPMWTDAARHAATPESFAAWLADHGHGMEV